MDVQLSKLTAKNFKGFEKFNEDFGKSTTITGKNEAGKTTIADMFYWLLLGVDSVGTKGFSPKPLDKNGNEVHRIETEVEGSFVVDGKNLVLKKIFREIWRTRKGDEHETFDKHENKYFIDDVPVSSTEFQVKVAEFIDKDKFKMLTSVNEFCTMAWTKRRTILVELAGNFSMEDVIARKPRKLASIPEILDGKSIEDRMKVIKHSLKKIGYEKDEIPSRIDEQKTSMKPEEDSAEIDAKIDELKKEKDSKNEALSSIFKTQEEKTKIGNSITEKTKEVNAYEAELKSNMDKPYNDALSALNIARSNYNNKSDEISAKSQTIKNLELNHQNTSQNIVRKNGEVDELRTQLKTLKGTSPNLNVENACPTCGVAFQQDKIDQKKQTIINKFVAQRDKDIKALIDKANIIKKDISKAQTNLENINDSIKKETELLKALEAELPALKTAIDEAQERVNSISRGEVVEDDKLKNLRNELLELNNKYTSIKIEDSRTLREEVSVIDGNISLLKSSLNNKEYNEAAKTRIKELEEKLSKISKQQVALEGDLFKLEEYIRERSGLLNDNVNSRFKYVKFRMFKNQVNGGFQETCDVTVKGVPYDGGLNNAARINAGLDVIDTLSKHYNLICPVFIDNSESVNKLTEIDNQLIKLKVTTTPLKIKVEEE